MTLICTIEYDDEVMDPSLWDNWRLVSFNSRHASFEDPYQYLGPLDKQGEPTPATLAMRNKLKAGTALILSCYQHSGTWWSLKGEGTQCQWDTARIAGLLFWVGTRRRDLPRTYEERQEDARHFLEVYNQWIGGDVYRYRIENTEDEEELMDGCEFYNLHNLLQAVKMDAEGRPVTFHGLLGREVADQWQALTLSPQEAPHA